ncbi:MAG: ADP-ribosylglycohydrolase family protein [Clostridia bacterium]|nr:ADP-ribosylglycohydrolase family protein [Clostridia bacterium]
MAGCGRIEQLLTEELIQLEQEGREIDRAYWQNEIAACGTDKAKLLAVYDKLTALPMRADFAYTEPTALSEIKKESNVSALESDQYVPVDDTYFSGAWLGRCIGCAWGQPCEGWRHPAIVEWYKNAGKYPVRSYFPTVSGDKRNERESSDEKLCGMPPDDDTRFTVLNYLLLKEKGYAIDAYDIGNMWSYRVPFRNVFTAESQAYLNFINCEDIWPWGKPENAAEVMEKAQTATYLNPYREWIGAQIRADAFGYVAAGMPILASELAYVDASFSHVKNGIYGEMFFAAMIAAAFVHKDARKCFDIALATIPQKSRFAEEVLWAKHLAETCETREELMEKILAPSEKYNGVHTINNATFCIAAIMRYPEDFRNAVAFAVECGMDTDCNGATVGSFMGALLGEQGIPADLSDAIKDTFSVGVAPYDNYSIRAFAKEVKSLREQLNSL